MIVALETLYYVLEETNRSETAVLLAAVLSVFQIYLISLVCLIALHLPIIKRYCAAFDLVFDGVVWTPQMLGDTVDRPAVFQSYFNFVSFFTQKVLTFPVFCGIISDVHSDDPFRIVFSTTSILPQNRYYGYSFLKTDYCNFILQRA